MSTDIRSAVSKNGGPEIRETLHCCFRSHCGPNWQSGEIPQLRTDFPQKNSPSRDYSLTIRCPIRIHMRGQGQGLCKTGGRFAGGSYAKDGRFPKCRHNRPG